jgi:hypothetical protein
MAKINKHPKTADRKVPVHLGFESRVVQLSPAVFILIEKMLKFVVVDVPGKVAVIPLLDRNGETGCYLYPVGTPPIEAMKKTVDALWNKGVSGFLRKMAKEPCR